MTTVAVMVAQLSVRASRQIRLSEHRRIATQEAGNLMEQVAAIPWDKLTPETSAQWQLADDLLKALPGAKLTAAVTEQGDAIPAKRIELVVSWNGEPGAIANQVRLVTWRFHRTEVTP